jgi:two-component system sensor histidine kinase CpxA
MPIIDMPDGEALRSVLMFISNGFFTNPFFFVVRPWLGIGAAAILISALCWLPLVRNLTRSIAEMERATARIAEGRFDPAVKPRRNDELGHLGASINVMAERLETFTDGRKRFLGAVAHELRSPIARMQLAAEILERESPAASQKYLADLKDDIGMMSRLTDELLQFARAEVTTGNLTTASTNLADAAQTAARREAAEGADIRVNVDSRIQVQANPEYLIRSLSNVLRNAVSYAGNKGPIEISAHQKDRDVEIHVTDCGPGVPEDALDKIFTPFYRLDEARDRRTGGTGLGLAIVRTCIEACGGAVECRNRRPSGLDVVITLPSA